jgi:glycosyltransferase involved in cell wall biosynthesis
MISIVIPTFQEENRLEKTLSSLTKLTLPHEIIISDGKSTDRTLEIARKYPTKIVVWNGETRQKPGVGRNDGAKMATGEFLAFIDSGCVIKEPDQFFGALLKDFSDPEIVAITLNVRVPEGDKRISDHFFQGLINLSYWFMNNVVHFGGAMGRFQIMRKSAYDKIGGYSSDLTFYEDVNMFQRLAKVGRTYYDRRLSVYHDEARARKVGWAKLMWLWNINNFWQLFFGRPYSKEWAPIR